VGRSRWLLGAVTAADARVGVSPFEKPQPEILLAGSVPITGIEAATVRHLRGLALGKRNPQPRIVRLAMDGSIALHLKLEQRSGSQ